MKIKKPIVDALLNFDKQQPISLHVPGHKNGLISNLPNVMKGILKYDYTELNGLDDLHYPEEAIAEAQNLLAQTYNVAQSFFLVNGSTVGNLAMIYATCQRGDQLLVQRNAHKSIFHALELVGVEAIYLMPEWDEHTKTYGTLTKETVQQAVKQYPHAKGLVITSPTYYGTVAQDLQQQIAICHAADIPVLVDEAHGAHLIASEQFPCSALQLGADIVVQSAHKTLPAMTMASYLHVNSERVSAYKIQHYLRMLQSSSPSYILLASLDEARHFLQTYKEADEQSLLERRALWLESLRAIKDVEIVECDDLLKVCLRVKNYSGVQIQRALEEQGVFAELADPVQVLFMLPLLKVEQAYPFAELRKRIKEAIDQLKKEPIYKQKEIVRVEVNKVSQSTYSMEQLQFEEMELISYTKAVGRISAAMIIPYPPGVPLFVPGEKITIAMLGQLEDYIANDTAFQGKHDLVNKKIYVKKMLNEER